MKWFELVFSDQPRQRYRRHVIFWITWWLYFTSTFLLTQQGFDQAISAKWVAGILTKSFLLLLCHGFMAYSFIYYLLPRFILKGRWVAFTSGFLVTGVITLAWSYFCYAILFLWLDSSFSLSATITQNVLLWTSVMGGLISALKVVTAAAAIKLLKRWWLKQKENQRLEKEKIAVELQLLKAQIHPDFLFSSLDKIYEFAINNPPKASEMLLKLSDLLSYMLYECEQPRVSLEKEIKMIRQYTELENIRVGSSMDMDIAIKGDPSGKKIAPLLLLPFIEHSFSYYDQEKMEKIWINLDLRIEEDELSMKLINGKPAEKMMHVSSGGNGLANVQKRLNILYPGNNEIRIHAEPEIVMTFVKIKLESPYQEENETENLAAKKEETSYADADKY